MGFHQTKKIILYDLLPLHRSSTLAHVRGLYAHWAFDYQLTPTRDMREQNIEVIRKACIAANPEIMELKFGEFVTSLGSGEDTRPIRLADVLLVIEGRFSEAEIITKDPYYETFGDIISRWNLRKDSLTDQSDECLAFLANLLK